MKPRVKPFNRCNKPTPAEVVHRLAERFRARKRNRSDPDGSRTRDNRIRGLEAEQIAERHLHAVGHATLERNLRVGRDEIDLLMLAPDRRTVVLVEVKSSSSGMQAAKALMNRGKRSRVARAFRRLERLGMFDGMPTRVDAVYVHRTASGFELEHRPGSPLPAR